MVQCKLLLLNANLFVYCVGAPEFLNGTNTTVDITFDEGNDLVIYCGVSQRCPLNTSITLNITGSGNPMNGQTFQLLADSKKIFSNALLSSSGSYICIADNGIAVSTLEYRAVAIPSPTGKLCNFPCDFYTSQLFQQDRVRVQVLQVAQVILQQLNHPLLLSVSFVSK